MVDARTSYARSGFVVSIERLQPRLPTRSLRDLPQQLGRGSTNFESPSDRYSETRLAHAIGCAWILAHTSVGRRYHPAEIIAGDAARRRLAGRRPPPRRVGCHVDTRPNLCVRAVECQ